MDTLPIPHDIPLPLPASILDLEVLLVFLFLLHILFVNLMVGGSILSLVFELRGRRRPELDQLARRIAATITVNKSMAVVLGVGPLLAINTLYTVHFYTANALTGTAWIMIVPLVATAFLITYAHKYSWDLLADRKGLHIAIGATASLFFVLVPFIFVANVNLMLFPDRWTEVHGFLSTMLLPNVLPRVLHFLVASVAVAALFLMGWLGREGAAAGDHGGQVDPQLARRELGAVAFGATALQLVAGPLLFLTLPASGLSWSLVLNISLGVSLAVAAMVLLWSEVKAPSLGFGRRYMTVVVLLCGTVIFMAYGRHLYREEALAPHRALMMEKTAAYRSAVLGAQMREAAGTLRIGGVETTASPGEKVFRAVCMACHAENSRRVGPPITEIVQLYAGNPDGLIDWVRKPGRKRADYQEMPPIRMRDDQYRAVANYVLEEALVPPEDEGAAEAEVEEGETGSGA